MKCSRPCYSTHHPSTFLFHSYQLLVILVFGPNQHEVTYENKTASFKELNPIIETSKMFTKLSKCNILPPVLNKLIWRSVLHCRNVRQVILELANSAHEAKEWERRLVLLSSEGQSVWMCACVCKVKIKKQNKKTFHLFYFYVFRCGRLNLRVNGMCILLFRMTHPQWSNLPITMFFGIYYLDCLQSWGFLVTWYYLICCYLILINKNSF